MTKTHKFAKNPIFAFFAMLVLVVSCLLTACGETSTPATMYNVTWDVATQATVTVEGYETLPTQVEEDTSLVFTVATTEGYEVSRVTRNSKRVPASSGKYTVKVTEDPAI